MAWKTHEGFPWGKHQEKPLEQVPVDYLVWALRSAQAMSAGLHLQVRAELIRRGYTFPPLPRADVEPLPDEVKCLRGE